jgi:hypothetical protein
MDGEPEFLMADPEEFFRRFGEHEKRTTCDANVAYEPPDQDWFGSGGYFSL